jgi:hypothetical protein
MEADTSAPADERWGYTGAAVAGAVLATLFFPLIALIVALLLLGPDMNATGQSVARSDGRFVFPCAISGTATVTVPDRSP